MAGRCLSCNSKLTVSEMCRKHAETGEYLQMCNNCLAEVLSIVTMPVTGDIFVRQTKEEEEDV
jgi:hypothetical protein